MLPRNIAHIGSSPLELRHGSLRSSGSGLEARGPCRLLLARLSSMLNPDKNPFGRKPLFNSGGIGARPALLPEPRLDA
jgi:hypothetical protein